MDKKLICISLVSLLLASTFARGNTPIETFIQHVRQTNTFTQVDNLWQADNNFDQTALLQKVEKAQPLTIDYSQVADFIKQNLTAVSLVVPAINGGYYTIDIAQYGFLSNSFEVHVMGANNSDGLFNYTPGLYYRGVVEGVPGSVAAFSFFNNEVYGVFSIPGQGNYTLVPNTMVGNYYNYNPHYILYNDNDLKIKSQGPGCATDSLPEQYGNKAARTTTTLSNNVYNNCTEVRVFEVGDYALYMTKGSSATNVTNYLTALFNNQSTLYKNEGIPIVLKYVQIDTVSDAYQTITTASSILFLDKFGYVTQNTLHGCDLAILASTALSDGYGQLGGVAWLQSLCSSYYAADSSGPYAFCDMDNSAVVNFPTYSWDVEVITHEMGHIVGSPHTHRCCWNPPGTGTTAIDGCYTLEGSCAIPIPALPVGGGTIMSYCHLTSDGTNFSNGFGTQPGDTIRWYISQHFSTSCGAHYNPTIAVSTANRIISANSECTDIAGGDTITYYFNDNNTADQTDDTLALMIQKHGNSIGTLDSTGFAVSSGTIVRYGSNTGDTITFPTGTTGVLTGNIAMRRYWDITATIAPVSPVEVMFPFTATDTSDVDGSVPGAAPLSGYRMYKVNSPVSPNPSGGFAGATSSAFSIYTYSTAPTMTTWSLSTVGTTNFAHMKMTDLSGGGTGFYSYETSTYLQNVNAVKDDILIYPNPASEQWFVSVSNNNSQSLTFQLYATDGRRVKFQILSSNTVNTVEATGLPAGIYYYHIIGSNNAYTGSIVKK